MKLKYIEYCFLFPTEDTDDITVFVDFTPVVRENLYEATVIIGCKVLKWGCRFSEPTVKIAYNIAQSSIAVYLAGLFPPNKTNEYPQHPASDPGTPI